MNEKSNSLKKSLKIGLALSGGGAKGFAHIAIIKSLEELSLPFYCIAGASMGALVGGWYAAGKDFKILEEIARNHQWRKFMPLREIFGSVKSAGGLFSLHAFEKFLAEHLAETQIENLPIKFCAIATSLRSGKEVKLDSGSLTQAVLASGCIPIVFAPIEKNGDLLVDGGLVNNFPVQACFEMGADLVIGVDTRYLPGHLQKEIDKPHYLLQWKIFKVMSYLMDMVNLEKEKNYDEKKVIVLKPYISHISTFDFDRIDEVLQLGEDAFKEKEAEIRQKLGLPPKEKTWWDKFLEG